MSEKIPFLSIVVTSRNDDHGGNLIQRMQIFINGLAAQCERHQLHAELVIVEWNPPDAKPKLKDALVWPQELKNLAIRIIEVSPEIHQTFSHAGSLPLFQMIGKNAGIRRAKGEFILATNIDVLFSDELISFVAGKRLEKGKIYRIDRDDVDASVPVDAPLDEQLAYCREHILRINRRLFTQSVHEKWDLVSFFKDYVVLFFHKTYRMVRYGEPYLHLNASGDFTLLSRDDWFSLRGYPEFETYSLHLDSIFCYAAFYQKIKEVYLQRPMQLFHIEHSPGSGCTPGYGEKVLMQRLDKSKIPILKYRHLIRYMNKLRSMDHIHTFNDERWGLSTCQLPEQQVQ